MATGQPHTQLLAALKTADATGSGRIALHIIVQTLARLGFNESDADRLVAGSGCVVAGPDGSAEVNYGAFIRWLVGAQTSDVMDAGCEAVPESLSASRLPAGGFGSWVDRCARVLETRGEVDFIQKKLITAQVRAHLRSLEDREDSLEPPSPLMRVSDGLPEKRGSACSLATTSSLGWDGPALVERLLQEGPDGIPLQFVNQVLDTVIDELPKWQPRALVRLGVPDDGRVVVVGDTHGQLQDVLLIMLLYGVPSVLNVYLFNGDVADRGPNACEILLLIFSFFIMDPTTVLMNRGNHEDDQMNMMTSDQGGGFYDECMRKYGERVYWKFVQVFKLLPLAAVVNDEVFVVHGGLPRGAPPSLGDIESVSHTEVCCPSPDVEDLNERLFLDLLWSDPQETPGHEANPRGAGALWGPDVTKAFLAKNGLTWIIRSHELPWDGERGWMEHHLGLVFTLFSASNYTGVEVNWGAVALLTVGAGGKVEQALREHNVSSLEILPEVAAVPEGERREKRCREIGLSWIDHDRVAVGERRVKLALRRLAGIVLELKPELWHEFRQNDPDNTGTIRREIWVDSLIKICGDDLPWQEASKFWIGDAVPTVDYRRFLDQFKVVLSQEKWCGWKVLVIQDVYEELLSRNEAAEDLLRTLDPTGDGIVSVDDFMTLMNGYSGGCLSEPQVAALSRTIFAHAQGRGLRISTFLSRFTVAFEQSRGMSSVDKQSPLANIGPTMEQIGKLILRAKKQVQPPGPLELERFVSMPFHASVSKGPLLPPSPLAPPAPSALDRALTEAPRAPLLMRDQSLGLVQTFERFNDSGQGLLQVDEFVQHILALPGVADVRHNGRPLDETSLRGIAETIADADGTINLLQFARAFAVVDASGSTDLADDLHEHILTFLFRHRDTLRSNCARHDAQCSGRVSRQRFTRVLEAVNLCTARPARQLTQVQMSVLVESIVEDDGMVEYDAFLSSFEVHTGW